jgi:hypothetical protein
MMGHPYQHPTVSSPLLTCFTSYTMSRQPSPIRCQAGGLRCGSKVAFSGVAHILRIPGEHLTIEVPLNQPPAQLCCRHTVVTTSNNANTRWFICLNSSCSTTRNTLIQTIELDCTGPYSPQHCSSTIARCIKGISHEYIQVPFETPRKNNAYPHGSLQAYEDAHIQGRHTRYAQGAWQYGIRYLAPWPIHSHQAAVIVPPCFLVAQRKHTPFAAVRRATQVPFLGLFLRDQAIS